MTHPARLLALALLLGCSGTDSLAPASATRVELGPRFTQAWAAIEECSGRTGRSKAVAVFSVPGDFITLSGSPVIAYWSSRSNTIYIAAFYVASDPVLRHEILHALLQSGSHPDMYFADRCGALVGTG